MKRILVNAMLAGVLALLAFGIQTGALAGMSGVVLADGNSGSCGTISSTPSGGSTLRVCGTYTGTVGATVTVAVNAVDKNGRITSVTFSNTAGTKGPQGTYSVNPSTGQVNGGAKIFGQTYTFVYGEDNSNKNKQGNKYTFGEKPHCEVKSKCED